ATYEQAVADPSAIQARILGHFATGLVGEEVMDLWNALIHEPYVEWYEEKTDTLHLMHPDEVEALT
ncbi:MAG: hypothetical protein K2W96_11930, partial [Gemmataceae bacterium]|nr:hypothetical protein [Gemmataceae bacterium]